MSCNGCRVLRKGCSESCVLRPCLQWINSPQSQANATAFLAKFYGRTGLINLITTGPPPSRPALFRSLLYEACGRIMNPTYGSVGLLWSGKWGVCQAGVESILQGNIPNPLVDSSTDEREEEKKMMQSRGISGMHKVKASCKFKCVNGRRKPKRKEAQLLDQIQNSSGGGGDFHGKDKWECWDDKRMESVNPKVEALYMENSEVKVEVELELTLGAAQNPPPIPH